MNNKTANITITPTPQSPPSPKTTTIHCFTWVVTNLRKENYFAVSTLVTTTPKLQDVVFFISSESFTIRPQIGKFAQ
jgi:hypothetical protein